MSYAYVTNHVIQYDRKESAGQGYLLDTITWIIQHLPTLVERKKNISLYSEESVMSRSKPPETRFQLKLKWSARTNHIKIYYLLPATADLSYAVYLNSAEGQRIAYRDKHSIQERQWIYLASVFKNDIIGNSTGMESQQPQRSGSSNMSLPIVFIFKVFLKQNHINHLGQLSDDFEQLFLNKLFSDVVMKSAEGTDFDAHKAVLVSRSPVLKAQFSHDTTESYTNIVESPFEADVLQEVLMFIYSNKATKVAEIPDRLLEAADYYQLDGLKNLCAQKLYERLTAENALDTLQLADRHHSDSLKQLTLLFIKDRAGKFIKKSGGWAKVESVALLKYTCDWFMKGDSTD